MSCFQNLIEQQYNLIWSIYLFIFSKANQTFHHLLLFANIITMSEQIQSKPSKKQKRRDLFETAPLSRNIFSSNLNQAYEDQQQKQRKQIRNKLVKAQSMPTPGLQKYKQDSQTNIEINRQNSSNLQKNVHKEENKQQERKQQIKVDGFIFQASSQSSQEDHKQKNNESHHKIIFEAAQDSGQQETSSQNLKLKPLKKTIELFGQKVQVDAELLQQQDGGASNKTTQLQNSSQRSVKLQKSQSPRSSLPTPKKQLLRAVSMMPENTFAKMKLVRNKSNGIFSLCLESNQRFILSCKHISGQTYHITQSMDLFNQNGPMYAGKVKASFFGNQVSYYTPGLNPQRAKQSKTQPRKLICTVVSHSLQILQQVKPRDFTVYLLKPTCDYYRDLAGVTLYEEQIPLNKLYHDFEENRSKILVYDNRKSKWNQKQKMYSLNMKGRAKLPSIKNFILESPSEDGREVMLLGKVEQNQFSFDIHHPLSPAIGMAIALTSFIHKSW